jgi:putative endonuclease
MWYVYILQSLKKPDWFYKGSTNDLKRRFEDHNSGNSKSTKPYIPLKLVYYEAYLNEKSARERESSIKQSGSVSTPLMKRIKESLGIPLDK